MDNSVTVVILAAGLGTRMKSRKAKVLHEAGGKPLVQHAVDTALQLAPAERIFVVVGHQADEVRAAVTTPGVGFVVQREQKGTGHALMAAREAVSGLPGYLVIDYGDGPLLRAATLRKLLAATQESAADCVLLSAMMTDPTGYGRVIRDSHGRVTEIVEQKAATAEQLAIREANMGIYCYRAETFWKHLDEIQPNPAAKEYYLTDMVQILHRAGCRVDAMELEDAREALGINNRVELAEVDRLMRERKIRELMLGGVTVEKPETVTIDCGVSIGMDTIVGPFAQILGNSTIGDNCRIGACSIVRDCALGDGVEIAAFTHAEEARVEAGAHIGPFARLRMGAIVGPDAHVGNFVELKKTRMGAGAKANHLAYLGDSEIGEKSNIGAGTITCNYDGVKKHPTKIGKGAFVGSNSTLVAPIEIGDGSYVAAGSVVTEAVPADALAVGRSRQVLKEDWARKRRELGSKKG